MPETIGQRLKFARQERLLSIEKAAEATRIRPHYLQALEADDYSVMPSAAQARGFLRNYASFLDLDLQAILAEIQASQPVEQVSGPLPQVDLAPPAPEAPANPPAFEEPKPSFWRSLLGWRDKQLESAPEPVLAPISTPEATSVPVQEPVPQPEPEEPVTILPPPENEAPVAIIEPPSRPRGRRKKVDEPLAVEEPPTRKRRTKKEDVPAVAEPVTQVRRTKKEDVPAVGEPSTRVRRKKKIEEPELPAEPKIELPSEPERDVPSPQESPTPPIEKQDQAEAEIPPVAEEQPEVQMVGGEPSLLEKLGSAIKSLFAPRRRKENPEPIVEEEPQVVEPVRESEPDMDAEPSEVPEEIFCEIGEQLRKRRELLSLTLEEIERHTHVREVFARALEEGKFDQLPSTVQTRGMLTTYATFLDLDTDALLLRYADALQAGLRARYPGRVNGERSERPQAQVRSTLPSLRSFMAGDLLFGIVIVVMIVGMAGWGLMRVFAQQSEKVALPTAPSISDVLAGTPLPTIVQEVTLIPAVDTPFVLAETATPEDVTPETAPTQDFTVNVFVNIVVTERTYMRVLVDGVEAFNGRVVPGAAYPYEGTSSVEVLTGNGAALRVTYNARDMGLLGNFGQVVDYIYTLDGIVTPTPPAPPTATATPKESPTPTQTETPTRTPTSTPTPKSTPTATRTPQS